MRNVYVLSAPNWSAYLPDGTHPDAVLAGLVARDVLLPRVPKCGGAA